MGKKTIILTIIFLAMGFTIVLFILNGAEKIKYSDVTIQSHVKIDGERNWHEAEWERNETFTRTSNESLISPVLLTSHDELIYVGDWGEMDIKVFNKEGENTVTLGRRGRGPGEFQRIMDIDFYHDSMFISDPEKHEVIIYSKNGDHSYSFRIDHSSNRLAVSDENIYTLAIQDSLFERYDHEGNTNLKFGKILDKPILNQLNIAGRIEFISEMDLFLYIPRFASYLFYYTADGKLNKIVETLDGIPFSESTQELAGERIQIRTPDTEVEIVDYYIDDENLYLLGWIMQNGDSLDNVNFIDVYSLHGDKYLHSFKTPVLADQFTIIENTVYFIDLTDQSLVAFNLLN